MKTALIIPTFNAGELWEKVLVGLKTQTLRPDRKIVLDSSSDDQTASLAEQYGFEVHKIQRQTFNAGLTRQMGAELCPEADILIYMTQDTIPVNPNAFATLLRCFEDPQVAAAYGRQLPRPEACVLERFPRHHLYPPESCVKTKQDIPALGLRTAFCSNSFAAYRRDAFMQAGGFPFTPFGEDMLIAARLLLAGHAVAYCAAAQVFHSHPTSTLEVFNRGLQIGRLHREHSWLRTQFGHPSQAGNGYLRAGLRFLKQESPQHILLFLLQSAVKFFGFACGQKGLL